MNAITFSDFFLYNIYALAVMIYILYVVAILKLFVFMIRFVWEEL
jgi:hypothetical protein